MRAQLKKIKFIIKYIYISVLFAFKKPKIRVLDDEETIQKVLRGYSLSRFGDGELRWAINAKDTPRFQNRNVILSEELKRILLDTPNNTLVCLPLNLINMKNKTYESKYFWKKFVVEYWKKIKPLIRYENIYGIQMYQDFIWIIKIGDMLIKKLIILRKFGIKKI